MTLIMNGIQFNNQNVGFPFEKLRWENKERLFQIINKHSKDGVVFLSGDVHWAELSQTTCASLTSGYIVPEFTSSGLTHTTQ